ncbi:hypothetical protein TTHERM_000695629 (macronuclear) [Tetrahymena thermophila SB210]|uniref:Uncharacterized protein n=1 Tax=Tetrahymena thermophila (strain SB210) TaxID=312017 RepID=W7XFH4_TETTS|nr:hypothetical protein TTHERM_000695629 [Tetrahymena thermophila SB210]EWS71544.1 hypothetical protein TTHERM_000695629 [Tetrahymena thermophila SB210]|eukprot:XP_012655927.1 hypothetical protein TTHERM_000695629 [Tetrahymena thermophila SB210]
MQQQFGEFLKVVDRNITHIGQDFSYYQGGLEFYIQQFIIMGLVQIRMLLQIFQQDLSFWNLCFLLKVLFLDFRVFIMDYLNHKTARIVKKLYYLFIQKAWLKVEIHYHLVSMIVKTGNLLSSQFNFALKYYSFLVNLKERKFFKESSTILSSKLFKQNLNLLIFQIFLLIVNKYHLFLDLFQENICSK